MRVMVVEDSQTMRKLIGSALQGIAGVQVVEAGDGADALAKLATEPADLILTDVNMPVMDGFTFVGKLRELPQFAKTPVIVLTTEGAIADQERGKQLGVAAYVTKPIRPAAIVETVKRVIGDS